MDEVADAACFLLENSGVYGVNLTSTADGCSAERSPSPAWGTWAWRLPSGCSTPVAASPSGTARPAATRSSWTAARPGSSSPRRPSRAAPVCLMVVSDDDACDELAPRILEGARPGGVLVEMSTISVAASTRIAERCAAADVDYLRAPFSGNPNVVRAGKASIFVSGDAEVARRVEPLLEDVAPTVRYVGEGERARRLQAGAADPDRRHRRAAGRGGRPRRGRRDRAPGAARRDRRLGRRLALRRLKVPALAHEDWSATFTTR